MQMEGFNQLLQRAKAKDPVAMEQLLAGLSPRLKHLALTQPGFNCPAESVSDLVQEVALRIWQKLDQFQGNEDDVQCEAMFYQWVDQIVKHMARDMRRDRSAQRRAPPKPILPLETTTSGGASGFESPGVPAANQESPSSIVRVGERERLIRAALESLTDETAKKILQLRFVDGLSLRQISDQLGISYDKVREQFNRSLRYLESKLEGLK